MLRILQKPSFTPYEMIWNIIIYYLLDKKIEIAGKYTLALNPNKYKRLHFQSLYS